MFPTPNFVMVLLCLIFPTPNLLWESSCAYGECVLLVLDWSWCFPPRTLKWSCCDWYFQPWTCYGNLLALALMVNAYSLCCTRLDVSHPELRNGLVVLDISHPELVMGIFLRLWWMRRGIHFPWSHFVLSLMVAIYGKVSSVINYLSLLLF